MSLNGLWIFTPLIAPLVAVALTPVVTALPGARVAATNLRIVLVQGGLVVAAILLVSSVPRRRNWAGAVGDTCPDMSSVLGYAAFALVPACATLGSVALACGIVAAAKNSDRGRSIGLSVVALVLPFLVAGAVIAPTFCGAN